MSYGVHITLAAWRDLEEITNWIAEHDSTENAVYVFERLLETANSVAEMPSRGSRPRELPAGMPADYRQVFFEPYRVIYRLIGETVVLYLIADGRRNLQSLLFSRLIAS